MDSTVHMIEIPLAIYRAHVVVSWEQDLDRLWARIESCGVALSKSWRDEFDKNRSDTTRGICMMLGERNTDVLVWLRHPPVSIADFGCLYHELYHAVDFVAHDHALEPEREARAYLFEFLAMSVLTALSECEQ